MVDGLIARWFHLLETDQNWGTRDNSAVVMIHRILLDARNLVHSLDTLPFFFYRWPSPQESNDHRAASQNIEVANSLE